MTHIHGHYWMHEKVLFLLLEVESGIRREM